jgi:DNA-binding protein HU-beta
LRRTGVFRDCGREFFTFFPLYRAESLDLRGVQSESVGVGSARFELRPLKRRLTRARLDGNRIAVATGRAAVSHRAQSWETRPKNGKNQMTNKAELIDAVAEATETSKAAAGAALDAVIAAITNALHKGEEVRLVGFGTFSVKTRAAGKGRNPATGTEITIPESKSVRFKPGAQLKTTVNK